MLVAVPNISEGRSGDAIAMLSDSFTGEGVRLLDLHSDVDHNRSVYTLVGSADELTVSVVAGGATAVSEIDIRSYEGLHPCIGVLDVAPIVYMEEGDRQEAESSALNLADRIADELGVPVFLYGDLATSEERQKRSFFRRGGYVEIGRRMIEEGLKPDAGPNRPHKTAGVTLVTARAPLVAFNLELEEGDVDVATALAECLRESSGGLPSVNAIGLHLPSRKRAQVSINVAQSELVPLYKVVEAAEREARKRGASFTSAEIVGLVPEAALENFPKDLEIQDFDPDRQILERRLAAL